MSCLIVFICQTALHRQQDVLELQTTTTFVAALATEAICTQTVVRRGQKCRKLSVLRQSLGHSFKSRMGQNYGPGTAQQLQYLFCGAAIQSFQSF